MKKLLKIIEIATLQLGFEKSHDAAEITLRVELKSLTTLFKGFLIRGISVNFCASNMFYTVLFQRSQVIYTN